MKRIIWLFSIVFCAGNLFAQNDSNYIKTGWGNIDYSVPESPAFNLLGKNPDNILKPSSVRSIALNIGNYYLNNGKTIPKNLAVEISPLLLNSKASLNDYEKCKFLYRTRFSIGTSILDNTGGYEMAEGIRFTLLDNTDLRVNDDFIKFLYESSKTKSRIVNAAIHDYAVTHKISYMDARNKYENDTTFKREINKLSVLFIPNDIVNYDSIAKMRDKLCQELWNAPIWEVGIATMQSSPDSLINNSVFNKVGLWSTYGTHLSKNDQFLIGGKFGMADSSTVWYGNISIGARYYYGGNELRAFVQGEYRYEKTSAATASLGCVFNITNGIWGQFAMNFIFGNNSKVIYKPSFNLSFGTPEKKKL